MAWKDLGEDRKVEIIVDPTFRGDLLAIAARHPIWVVRTPGNSPKIEASWEEGAGKNLHEINQFEATDPNNREESLMGILNEVHNEHGYTSRGSYDGIVVNGLRLNDLLRQELASIGFDVTEATPEGFVAIGRLPESGGTRGTA